MDQSPMETKTPRPRGRPRKVKRPEEENDTPHVKVSPKSRGRPRKLRREEDENDTTDAKLDAQGKWRFMETRAVDAIAFVGRYVLKEFEGNGVFLGKVVYYDSGLYRVEYEDGDCEDLDSGELRHLIISDDDFDKKLIAKRKKLEKHVLKNSIKKNGLKRKYIDLKREVDVPRTSTVNELSGKSTIEDDGTQDEGDADSSCDLYERVHNRNMKLIETPLVPLPLLPPSSGNIGVPEESASHLFSVYGFLRSFSIQLFLYPFGLDDFVGALNCHAPNSLLDAIYLALMKVLQRHLESLSSDGSTLAIKCLRCVDWNLLDALTWPVYLVQYFSVMGYHKVSAEKEFYVSFVENEYYSLPVSMKLLTLQILCDDVLDSEELRAEIDSGEEFENEIDPDAMAIVPPDNRPRRVHPRFSKTSACKDKDATVLAEKHVIMSSGASRFKCTEGHADATDVDQDANCDECRLCGMDGTLLCCDGCPSSYHSRCIGVMKVHIPGGSWYCPECMINKMGPTIMVGASNRGADVFGADLHGQIFLGTCNHLLVLKASINKESQLKYYNINDIPVVVQALLSSGQHKTLYSEIVQAIKQYWNIPKNLLSPVKKTDISSHVKKDDTSRDIETGTSLCVVTEGKLDCPSVNGPCRLTNQTLAARTSANSRLRVSPSSKIKTGNNGGIGRVNHTYMGSSFKPRGYINHYMNGDLAASAAAKLAALISEENHSLEANKSAHFRKAFSTNSSLQIKAFSSAASRFVWPSIEKKDITRERCGWCYSCKLTSSSKRGCMLNAAVTSAAKIFGGLLPLKTGEGSLPSIAAYVLYMEASLRGIVTGPFTSQSHRKQWRRQVEEASTCRELKALLLKLGENISTIALSRDWTKLRDDCFVESFNTPNASCSVETPHKRGPGGKHLRKQSEVPINVLRNDSIRWWRGGKISSHIDNNLILPYSMVRKAVCQGGVRKISGFNYIDGSEIPKRSKKLVWRAAVERTRNASQLALQVRYLDSNVRWNDLIRPEQNLQDGKRPDIEANVFRNANIFDKKIVGSKIRYGVTFTNQKQLPTRVLKNVIGVEKIQGGKDKFWFSEKCIPLFLIKEFEERAQTDSLSSVTNPRFKFSELQRKQLKASRQNIFSYLMSKRDNSEKCYCASCQLDVIVRNAVTCRVCEGYCHKDCTISSNSTNKIVELSITCKQCYQAKALNEIDKKHPTTPLPSSKRQHQDPVIVTKHTQLKASNKKSKPVRNQESSPEIKQPASNSSLPTKSRTKVCSWGVIWRKKNIEDTGIDFRRENILLSGCSDNHSLKPVCDTCQQPYNYKLSYIHCGLCNRWYHGEAIELDESRISDIVGFKCCKCRRIRSPDCPYMDPELKEQKNKKRTSSRKQQQGDSGIDSDRETTSEVKQSKPTSPMLPLEFVYVPDDDPLLFSLSRVEQISENNSEWNTAFNVGLQKLPVRRQGQQTSDTAAGTSSSGHILSELSVFPESNTVLKSEEEQFRLAGSSVSDLVDELLCDDERFRYEDMEFEPQAYFSSNELQAFDEGSQFEIPDTCFGTLGNTSNPFSHDKAEEQEFGLDTSNYISEATISVRPVDNADGNACFDTLGNTSIQSCSISHDKAEEIQFGLYTSNHILESGNACFESFDTLGNTSNPSSFSHDKADEQHFGLDTCNHISEATISVKPVTDDADGNVCFNTLGNTSGESCSLSHDKAEEQRQFGLYTSNHMLESTTSVKSDAESDVNVRFNTLGNTSNQSCSISHDKSEEQQVGLYTSNPIFESTISVKPDADADSDANVPINTLGNTSNRFCSISHDKAEEQQQFGLYTSNHVLEATISVKPDAESDANNVPFDTLGNTSNGSCSISHDKAEEQRQFGLCTSNHESESTNANVGKTRCRICSHSEPSPDLLCTICGVSTHRQCCPLEALSPTETSWSCLHCRDSQ